MKSSDQLKHLNKITQIKHKKAKRPNNVPCYTAQLYSHLEDKLF